MLREGAHGGAGMTPYLHAMEKLFQLEDEEDEDDGKGEAPHA